MPTRKGASAVIAFFVIAVLLLSFPQKICADTDVKAALLEKARVELIARLEKTQPKLAEYFKKIDAAKWGRYAGEISAGNGQAVFDEILQEKKKEMDKLYGEMMDDLYKKGKEYAISKGVLGADTEQYLGWAEEYGNDALGIAEKTYSGDFKGAGDIVRKKMKEKLQVKAKELLTGAVTDTIDFFLKDLAGQSVGAIYLKILEFEMTKIEEFRDYSQGYFATFSVTPPGGKKIERDWCTQYMEMRKRGHNPDFSFNGVDADTGLLISIADYVVVDGRWYSTTTKGVLPDAPTMIKELELCYIHSKVEGMEVRKPPFFSPRPLRETLQALMDATRANADRKLFWFIKAGMDERRQQIIIIINGPKRPNTKTFSLFVTVEDQDTGKAIPGAAVTAGSDKKDAPQGVAAYTLDADAMGESIGITAEARGYDSKTESFSKQKLAAALNIEKEEVRVKLSLKPLGKLPGDFTVDVTVTDKKTGNRISGSKATFDGEAKDAPDGSASFTRKPSMFAPDKSGSAISVSAEAAGYQPATSSSTIGELANKLNKDTSRIELAISLEPQKEIDEVDRLEIQCGPKEIVEDEASICNARVYFKSGKTKDVGAGVTWTPGFVDASKGTVKGQEVKTAHPLPYTVTAEATYVAPVEEGGKSWVASGTVLVKPAAAKPQPQVKLQKAADALSVKAGDKVTYTYSVSNPGKAGLDSVKVSDDKCSPVKLVRGDANNNNVLDPGETWTYECSAVLKTTTENTATVEAYSSGVKATDQAAAKVTVGPPALVDEVDRIEIQCSPKEIVEDEASICNAKVYFKSGKTKDVNGEATWTPGFVDTSKGTVRGQEVKAAHPLPYTVTAEATYVAPAEEGGKSWVARDTVLVNPAAIEPPPQIKILKAADAKHVKPGERVSYAYSVTNTGKVAVGGVKVSDDKCSPVKPLGGDANKNSILDPGETWTYECSAVLTATTDNTATVEGYTPAKVKAADRATLQVTVGPCPPPRIKVPYVLYMTEDDGKAELQKNKLKGNAIRKDYSTTFKEGTIMEEIPPDGDCVDPDSTVGLVISRGPKREEPPAKPAAALEAKLDCSGFLELLPGQVSESCGVMVKNWNSDTTERVEIVFPQQGNLGGDLVGGIVASPAATSSDPTNMHVAGVQDPFSPYYGWYTFSEGFSAKPDAKPGTSAIQIVVRQGGQEVQLKLTITVLPKGATRSTGPGLRPPAEVSDGSGGIYCVWRYKLMGDAPACFHYHAAPCASYPSRAGYDLVGQNMKLSEADKRIGDLSRYFSDQYGCERAASSPPEQPPPPPAVVKPGSGGTYCVWRYKLFGDAPACFHFHAAPCASYPSRTGYELVGQDMKVSEADARIQELSRYFDDNYACSATAATQPDCALIAGSSPVADRASGKVSCQCPADTVINKARNACIPGPQKQLDAANCGGGTVAKWNPDAEEVNCVCPDGTTLFNNACMTDKDIKMAQTDCTDKPGTSPLWNPDTQQADCACPSGTTWVNNACMTDKEVKMAQADCRSLPGSVALWDEGSAEVKCVCPEGRKLFSNACMTDKEILALSATGAITAPPIDCSAFPGTSAKLDPAAGQARCLCPAGTSWFNNACAADRDVKLAQTDCRSYPGTSAQWDEAAGQARCICPSGTTWFHNSCMMDRDIKMAQADCRSYPGTSPQWDQAAGQARCVCPSGMTWLNNTCMTDRDIKMAQADCRGYPGTSPQWDQAAGQARCVCPAGTKWFNNACTDDKDIKLAQADCKSYPGTSPQWDPAAGQVRCICPSGTQWVNNGCRSDKDIKLAQTDCRSYPGTGPQWDQAAGLARCVCPAGTAWFNNSCMTDRDIKMAQANCRNYPGTSPQWDQAAGQARCVCPSGTAWLNNTCMTDMDIKLAQANCRSYPGTSPRWDQVAGQVRCVCPSGTQWFNNSCRSDKDIKPVQTDCRDYPGTTPQRDPATGQVKCACPAGTKWLNNACRSDKDIKMAQTDCRAYPGTTAQWDPTTGQVKCACPAGTKWDPTRKACLAGPSQGAPATTPAPAATGKGQCDPPICIDMCKKNCQSFAAGAIDFCTHGCDTARACTAAEKEAAKSLAKVKAACFANILSRCNQGQAGRTGNWCVGPGADKTCDKRAHSICGCNPQTHPQCGGNWE